MTFLWQLVSVEHDKFPYTFRRLHWNDRTIIYVDVFYDMKNKKRWGRARIWCLQLGLAAPPPPHRRSWLATALQTCDSPESNRVEFRSERVSSHSEGCPTEYSKMPKKMRLFQIIGWSQMSISGEHLTSRTVGNFSETIVPYVGRWTHVGTSVTLFRYQCKLYAGFSATIQKILATYFYG